MNHLLSFFGSFGLALFLTWYVRGAAVANRWVSAPESYRHVHDTPVPRLGGIAIFIAFVGVTGLLVLAHRLIGVQFGFSSRNWLRLLGPALLIFSVGLYDDIKNAGPYLKFAVQIGAAVWLFANGYRVVYAPLFFGGKELGLSLSVAATIFWVVLITNAFNLIDGVDGLAAGSALFSTIVVFVIALLKGNFFASMTSAVLAGCILAFLRYNFHPATVFLGDSGSLFIGFVLSALGLASSQESPTMIAVAIPVVACGLPVLETGFSVVRRFMNNKPLFMADREHIHHKLLAMGLSQRQVVAMLYGVSALFAGTSLLLFNGGDNKSVGLALAVVGTVVWVALQRVGYLEVSELQRVAQRTIDQKRIMANNLSIRRACEKLKKCTGISEMCPILQEAFEKNEFDRFELTFPFPSDAAVDVAPLVKEKGNTIYYKWARNGATVGDSCWSLSLPLNSSARPGVQGTFVLFRTCGRVPLRMDVNLLLSLFPESVSAAMDLALYEAAIPAPSDRRRTSAA
jgi:UDP-GlcNAc:undecaprenyl-phosphate/decaprenyl-phosphate GlcNAc-1-phosphate transferase